MESCYYIGVHGWEQTIRTVDDGFCDVGERATEASTARSAHPRRRTLTRLILHDRNNTSLLTSKLFGLNFVIHIDRTVFPVIRFDFALYRHSMTAYY